MQLDINLFDPSLRPRKVLLPARIFAPALAAVGLLLLTCAVLQSYEIRVAEQARRQVESQSATLQTDIRKLSEQLGARRVSPEVQAQAASREALRASRESAVCRAAHDQWCPGRRSRALPAGARTSVNRRPLADRRHGGGDRPRHRAARADAGSRTRRGLSPPSRTGGNAPGTRLQSARVSAADDHGCCGCHATRRSRVRGHLGCRR